jgi:hypothetical protein
MLPKMRICFLVAAALVITAAFWGCDRLKNSVSENQIPVVYFVNVPPDSSVFNYAPLVRWTGYDSDGLISAFQYTDDTTGDAQTAYFAMAANPRALTDFAVSHALTWTTTYHNQDTIYLRRNEGDTLTTHIFMIRAVDNDGGLSLVKGRRFSRTNLPPNTPKVKWALDVTRGTDARDYQVHYVVPDTLFWGDTITSTYGGIGFQWEGSDPDSRELNIIPLTFSWLLVNETTGDTMPYPMMDDSNRVIGYGRGWSPWSNSVNAVFTAASARTLNSDFQLDGFYRFRVRVRDDGLTQADTSADATFFAYHPRFERQVLIVDWNKHPTSAEVRNFGLRDDGAINGYYRDVIPQGLQLAEQIRQRLYNNPLFPQMYIPDPIEVDTAWFSDKVLSTNYRVPYEMIRHFRWVWFINDNSPTSPPATDATEYRLKVIQDYLNVGGQVMLSGRRLFNGTFNFGGCGTNAPTEAGQAPTYFFSAHHLTSICAKPKFLPSSVDWSPDFGGAITTVPYLPNLEVDTLVAESLTFGGQHYSCLPEVEFFGRSQGTTSTEGSTTLYTYNSCTSALTWEVTNEDCGVDSSVSTATQAVLIPVGNHTRILNVTRVYNVTRNVYGEFMYVTSTGEWPGVWRIVVSTPREAGIWTSQDSLQVDYTYVPIDPSHDQPVASDYSRFQAVLSIDYVTGRIRYIAESRFRTAVFCFPLSFVRNDTTVGVSDFTLADLSAKPGAWVVAYQALFFNAPKSVFYEFSGTGGIMGANVPRFPK